MMNRFYINLNRFGEDGDGAGTGQQNNPGATFSYEQANEIAEARAERAKNSALKSYFSQHGMSEAEVTAAIASYKEQQKKSLPDVSGITRERDEARKELEQMKNEKSLSSLGVKAEYMEYVAFAVAKNVTDKKDFATAAKEFIEKNPMYAGTGMKVSTGSESGGNGNAETKNERINSMIRDAFGRK